MAYLTRVIDTELDELLPHLPAILLDGPKGVGKTETGRRRARSLVDLGDPAIREVAEADPAVVLLGESPVLLDEWQLVSPVWDAVRRAVDIDGTGGRFLLAGSAPAPGTTTHSGAGRIATVRVRPMTLMERGLVVPSVSLRELLASPSRPGMSGVSPLGLAEYVDLLLASGLPGLRSLSGRALRSQLDGYIERIVDRDLPELGYATRHPQMLLGWLRAYAAASATTATWEALRDAATSNNGDKPARGTTITYVEMLRRLRVLDPLPAWQPSRNHLRRLAHADKHHLMDPAIAARLVGVNREALLRGAGGHRVVHRDGTFLGALFESMAALQVRVFAQAAEARVFHLRQRDGRREIDLIVERDDGAVVAIEVKLSSTVDDGDVRHLAWLEREIGEELLDAVVVTTGPRAYRRADGIAVVPLALLGP